MVNTGSPGNFNGPHHGNEAWRFEKKVPLAVVLLAFIQTAGFAFWMGQLSVRVDQVELHNLRNVTNADRLIRLEVRIENLTEAVKGFRSGN